MLGKFLRKHIEGLDRRERDYKGYGGRDEYGGVYFFPPLAECRADFCKQLGQEVGWDGPDDWLKQPEPKDPYKDGEPM
jgi:hypothetical protein